VAPQPPVSVSLTIHVDIPLAGLESSSVDELLLLAKRLREIHSQAEASLVARRKSKLKSAKVAPAEERRCGHCGKVLTRKVYTNGKLEAPSAFAARDYCDRSCSRRATVTKGLHGSPRQNPVMEEGRECAACGNPLVRKRQDSGKLEPLSDFRRRRTCGVKCGGVLQRGVAKPGAGPKRKATRAKAELPLVPDSSHLPSVKSAAESRQERKEPPAAATQEERWSPPARNQVLAPAPALTPEPAVEPEQERAEAPGPRVERTPPVDRFDPRPAQQRPGYDSGAGGMVVVERLDTGNCAECGRPLDAFRKCRECERRETWRAGHRTLRPRVDGGS
jgi:hypothetical protein